MRKQHGQSAVEFALMAPIIFFMIFGMIYGGIMFMEYMHYSNAVRTAARQVAVSNEAKREDMIKNQEAWLTNLWQQEAGIKFYEPKVKIEIENNYATDDTEKKTPLSKDVVVNVTFWRAVNIPVILDALDFPPLSIRALQYHMRVEEAGSSAITTDDTSTNNTTTSETPAGSSLVDSTESAIAGS